MTSPTVLVGVPVYEGWDLVGETLDSIRRQRFQDYRVLISVDGDDRRSYEACEAFTRDPRFQLVLQPSRLRWEGNLTWLGRQLREDFFCYWQHDDLCHPAYLETLLGHAVRHPEASSIYCDMQSFGEKEGLRRYPSVTGFALERVLAQIERNGPAPIRCLVRAAAMRAALPITQVGPWAVTLAREGELHRVEKRLYFRRVRQDSLSAQMRSGGAAQLRASTLEWGVEVLGAALPAAPTSDGPRLLRFVADQLVNHQPRRNFHFDARAAGSMEATRFMAEFLVAAQVRFGVVAFPELLGAADPGERLQARLADLAEPAVELLMVRTILADLPSFWIGARAAGK